MAEYKSRYTGQEIDAGIDKANTAVQPEDLANVATSGSYNDLSDKPSEVTETTVANWGFTKNTGTYSKPSGGIPKTDLAEAVQTSLGKADTAIQEHQSLDNYYTKEQVDGKVSSVYRYRGTVATYEDLPSTSLVVGDVYNVETDGSNYAWNGIVWDKLGGDIDLSGYQTKIDSSHKLSADVVDDTSSTNKFVTANDKTTWNGKSVVSGTNDGTNWTALTIDGTTKNIPVVGTSVVANPTLVGGEDTLESIQIGSTKYETKGIYPVDISIEQVPPQYETVDVTTTIFGDMTGTLTDESVYKATTSFNVTFWDTNLEPDRTGSKLKSVFIAVPSSFANTILSIVGSTSPVGEPTDTKAILQNKATASMSNFSIICKVTLKAGLNEYTLDGNDTNVEIVTQSMIDSAPQCIGYFNPNGNDTGAFYFMATDTLGTELFGGYWNQGASAFHRTLGINWKYEKTIEVSPAENDLVLEMSNGDEVRCSLDDVPITVEIASPLKDKKISFVGDSITDTTVVAKPYWGYIQDATHCTSIGYGIDGSTISNLTDHHPMYARISGVDINSDAVCVFGGTNDFGNHVTIGDQYTTDGSGLRTLNTNTSTFWGALNQMCINLQDRFATKSIYLCTPLRRGNFKTNTMNDKTPNNAGEYLDEYADAIRKACEWFSFNLIDLYATSGLYPYDADNASTYYMGTANAGDYLHPNANGHQRIAKVMQLIMEKSFIK